MRTLFFACLISAAFVINSRLSFRNIPHEGAISPEQLTGLYANNQEHISPGFKAFAEFEKGWGLSGGVYGQFYSTHYAKSPSLNVGLFRKW